ncbi:MAG: hypothetical protein RL488_893, partial [Actinomycetota bacterium]
LLNRQFRLIKRLPAHPSEPSYPCYLSILGELAEVTPHGESFVIVFPRAYP